MQVPAYRFVVAGAGPAGVAVVGALLHYAPTEKIAWVDPDFSGGRLSKRYRDVSSNTKVRLFIDYAKAFKPLQDVSHETPKPNAYTALQELEQNQGCRLSYAADLVQMLSNGLRRHPNVDTHLGRIEAATREADVWTMRPTSASNHGTSPLESESLVLCTGSSPTTVPLPSQVPANLDLDAALDRKQLQKHIPSSDSCTIGIVGTSHSAVVVIMNLWELVTTTHPNLRIKWFVRSDMQYAVEMDGWILRDNTGLKSLSADFARQHLESGAIKSSPVGKVLNKVHCPDITKPDMIPHLDQCDFVVQAIGYTRDKLPELQVDGKAVETIQWDPSAGKLLDGNNQIVPQAYGAGIAFPRRTTDPLGNKEWAVGMRKFSVYLNEVAPLWLQDRP